MRTIDESIGHLRGETRYIDDLPEPKGCLHAAVRLSESARGRILSIDADAALALDPSVMVLRAEDLPGENQIGFTKPDEPVLPEEEWEYWGQPIALVLAETRQLARKAAAALVVHWEDLPARNDPRGRGPGATSSYHPGALSGAMPKKPSKTAPSWSRAGSIRAGRSMYTWRPRELTPKCGTTERSS
jgi:xanthine dehydrogenase molybdopterin-binding subunit B